MGISLNKVGIDPTRTEDAALLKDLQCNILKSHGRDFTAHLFLRFTAEKAQATAVVGRFAADYVTSAYEQYEQKLAWTRDQIPGGLVGAFFLSAKGYAALGFDPDAFGDTDGGGAFQGGMKRHGLDIVGHLIDTFNKDPDPATWDAGYQNEIHAMLLLADDDIETVNAAEQAVRALFAPVAEIVQVERGNVLRNEQPKAEGKAEPPLKGQPIEHFGYLDGRSNPAYLQSDIDKEKEGGIDQWNPAAPLNLVLAPDPYGLSDDSYGSYFVFRKLEQNVEGFDLGVRDLASKLGISPELAGAMCVGRFKDGTPLTLTDQPGLKDVNNFNYAADDRSGDKCPFHAHVRKVNPRGTTPFTSSQSERSRRITRRGIPYGQRNEAAPPREGVGLLFMCYQADIHHQFEFIQRTWSDNPNFPRNLILPDTGDDPLIGQDFDANAAQKWPTSWDSDERKRRNFGGYVTLKGGEYFFAPSMSFFDSFTAE